MSEVEYWLLMLYWTGFEAYPFAVPLRPAGQLSKQNENLCLIWCWFILAVCSLSQTLTLTPFLSPSFFFTPSPAWLRLCLSAVFKWWSEEESFQPMLMWNSEQHKEIHPRVLCSCAHLSSALLFTLSVAACKDERQTKLGVNNAWFRMSHPVPRTQNCVTTNRTCCGNRVMPAEGSVAEWPW